MTRPAMTRLPANDDLDALVLAEIEALRPRSRRPAPRPAEAGRDRQPPAPDPQHGDFEDAVARTLALLGDRPDAPAVLSAAAARLAGPAAPAESARAPGEQGPE